PCISIITSRCILLKSTLSVLPWSGRKGRGSIPNSVFSSRTAVWQRPDTLCSFLQTMLLVSRVWCLPGCSKNAEEDGCQGSSIVRVNTCHSPGGYADPFRCRG